MNATNCPSCRRPIRPGARFCGNCGTVLAGQQPASPRPDQQRMPPQPKPSVPPQPGSSQHPPAPAPVPPQVHQNQPQQPAQPAKPKKRSNRCPRCNEPIRSNVRFCGKCGTQIGTDVPNPSPRKGVRVWLIALLLVLLVAAGVSAFYLIYFNPFGIIGGSNTPTVEPTPAETEPVIEDTPTPTITLTETVPLPTDTPEPDTPTPTETPVPTDTPTLTPVPTLTFTPLPPLIDEPFVEPLNDRWWLPQVPPQLDPNQRVIKLNGNSLDDHFTNIKLVDLKPGRVIQFRVSVPDNNSLAFRWDITPNVGLPPIENAPLSLRFSQGSLNIRYAVSKNEFTECRLSIRSNEPNEVKIEIHDGKTVMLLNGLSIPECSSAFSKAIYTEPTQFGSITFSGNGFIFELKVFTNQ
jgi:hypothetical protein